MIKNIISNYKELINIEREYEKEERTNLLKQLTNSQLAQRGLAILKLNIVSVRTGLGGKLLLELAHVSLPILPTHRFRNGDVVLVSIQGNKKSLETVVYKISESRIVLYLMEEIELDQEFQTKQLNIVALSNEITWKRMLKTLNEFEKDEHLLAPFVRVIFGTQEPSLLHLDNFNSQNLYNKNLNDSQIESLQFALSAEEFAFIHGPPGTGKTMTLVEIIMQLICPSTLKDVRPCKVLVCAPSNVAVDNLIERLVQYTKSVVRLGHPARIMDSISQYSLDSRIQSCDESEIVQDIRKEMDDLLATMKKPKTRDRKRLWQEHRSLKKEYRQREEAVVQTLLKSVSVICCTLNGATNRLIDDIEFDAVVVDEATQSLVPECLIAMTKTRKKVILAGDPCQLPPTVQSPKAMKGGLEKTIFDFIPLAKRKDLVKMLTIQYRMNELIMKWSSDEFYTGRLIADSSVQNHTLADLIKSDFSESPFILYDTTGSNYYECTSDDLLDDSKFNQNEAILAEKIVRTLIQDGLDPKCIAIISPYNAQVSVLSNLLKSDFPLLEIGSVDGFQGREKEAVIISLVRSNDNRDIGFLSETRRTNVAITRAKRFCCVIGNGETLASFKFFNRMIDYISENGQVRYVDE